MSYPTSVLREARSRQQAQQHELESQAERIRQDAYLQQPRLRTLDIQLKKTVAMAMSQAFQHREDPTAAIEKAKQENLAAQAERSQLLTQLQIPDYLDAGLRCPHCSGTGWNGTELCDCLRQFCREVQMEQFADLPGANQPGFGSFRLEVYSPSRDETYGISPREHMRQALSLCRDWVENFSPESRSLLLSGGTGLGKTLLSACIARSLTARDVGVCYARTGQLLRAYEEAKFGSEQRPRRYEEAELLILDDLGTEMTTQFTNSVLYDLLDLRLNSRRPTVLSTNLPVSTLQQRYPPQLISRLLGRCEMLIFFGDDLRLA